MRNRFAIHYLEQKKSEGERVKLGRGRRKDKGGQGGGNGNTGCGRRGTVEERRRVKCQVVSVREWQQDIGGELNFPGSESANRRESTNLQKGEEVFFHLSIHILGRLSYILSHSYNG